MAIAAEMLINPGVRSVEKPRPSVVCSNSVSEAFNSYNAVPDNELDRTRARAKLRRILRQTKEVNPKIKPKYLSGHSGEKQLFFAHRSKPEIVYLGYEKGGTRFFEKVVFYDSDGRPSFRQA